MKEKLNESETKNKKKYRVSNWKEYNESLVNRGRITLWFDEESLQQWYEAQKSGKPGASNTYSDQAILCGLTIREVFRLPLRATEGLMLSLVELMNLELKIPDYTTFSRRQKDLKVELPSRQTNGGIHVVLDSTGLKVYGEGEWKVRQHGISKRRTWRKLHLAINSENHEILVSVLSSNDYKDSEVFEDLMNPIAEETKEFSADGAYDTFDIHEYSKENGMKAIVPPQKNAVPKYPELEDSPILRDQYIREIEEIGREEWKQLHGYHKRSLAETAMFRYKKIFGDTLKNRTFDNQATEAFIRCLVLNKMTQLGMPLSCQVM